MLVPYKFTKEQAEEKILGFIQRVIKSKQDEKNATLMVEIMMFFGHFEKTFKVKKIIRHRFEYQLSKARIDLILFHSDGGVTIIELKAEQPECDVVKGIGQLFYYKVLLAEKMRKSPPPKYVNLILAAPLQPEKSLGVMKACEAAGGVGGGGDVLA